MDERQVVAYFVGSQDARMALNALKATNAEVDGPQPVHPPQDGRAWRLIIRPELGGLSRLYQDPTLLDQIVGIIWKYGGITSAGSTSPVED